MEFQTTLGRAVRLRGIGLHSGEACEVTLHPAQAGFGLAFQVWGRGSLGERRGKPGVSTLGLIPVHYDQVELRERCTALGTGRERVLTVEHLLAALMGMEVDNALIEVEGGEVPALDGSAAPFAEAVAEAEVVQVTDTGGALVPRNRMLIEESVTVQARQSWITVLPGEELSISCRVEYPGVDPQVADFSLEPKVFRQEIAPARTFAMESDLEDLRAKGLARGGSLENAIVVGSKGWSSPPRFENELARHKLLDVLGDLSLLGAALRARVSAFRPGHELNHALVRRLAEVGMRSE